MIAYVICVCVCVREYVYTLCAFLPQYFAHFLTPLTPSFFLQRRSLEDTRFFFYLRPFPFPLHLYVEKTAIFPYALIC